jgi:hypothetical protein
MAGGASTDRCRSPRILWRVTSGVAWHSQSLRSQGSPRPRPSTPAGSGSCEVVLIPAPGRLASPRRERRSPDPPEAGKDDRTPAAH